MSAPRLGWLGGSFDPVHEGHVALARAAADQLGLRRVLLVPAAQAPHKAGRVLAPGADRLALLALAAAVDQRLVPDDRELRRGGVSYSLLTALELSAEHPGLELCFVIGADMLVDLPNWWRIEELARLVSFCPVARPGFRLDLAPVAAVLGEESARRIAERTVTMPPHPASSSAVRAALAAGGPAPWLPPGVEAEIRRRGLYGAGGATSIDSSGSRRS